MIDKSVEYEQALSTYRFYHEYRMKVLNYTIAFNGVLIVVASEHLSNTTSKLMMAVLAITATLLMFGLEIRTINFANNIWKSIIKIEDDLEYKFMTKLQSRAQSKGIPQRIFIWIFYITLIIVWVLFIGAAFYGGNTTVTP